MQCKVMENQKTDCKWIAVQARLDSRQFGPTACRDQILRFKAIARPTKITEMIRIDARQETAEG